MSAAVAPAAASGATGDDGWRSGAAGAQAVESDSGSNIKSAVKGMRRSSQAHVLATAAKSGEPVRMIWANHEPTIMDAKDTLGRRFFGAAWSNFCFMMLSGPATSLLVWLMYMAGNVGTLLFALNKRYAWCAVFSVPGLLASIVMASVLNRHLANMIWRRFDCLFILFNIYGVAGCLVALFPHWKARFAVVVWALYTTPATLLDALPASMQRVFTFYVLIGSMIVWGVLFFLLFTGAHPYDNDLEFTVGSIRVFNVSDRLYSFMAVKFLFLSRNVIRLFHVKNQKVVMRYGMVSAKLESLKVTPEEYATVLQCPCSRIRNRV